VFHKDEYVLGCLLKSRSDEAMLKIPCLHIGHASQLKEEHGGDLFFSGSEQRDS
jgi:hypothetical protein